MSDTSHASLGAALRNAWNAWRRNPGEVLLFLLMQITVRLIAALPLLALFTGAAPWIALASPVLFVLLVMPARRRAAFGYRSLLRGGPLFVRELGIGWKPCGRLLLDSLRTALCALCWAAPLIAAAVWAYGLFRAEGVQGSTDGLTIIRHVAALGGGDPVMGALWIGVIVVGLILLAAAGLAFHSGARHDEVIPPKAVRGFAHRGRVLAAWLLGFACFLPFIALMAWVAWDIVRPAVGSLFSALKSFGKEQEITEQGFQQAVQDAGAAVRAEEAHGWRGWALAGGFLLLFLPVLPLKGLFSAAAVDSLKGDA